MIRVTLTTICVTDVHIVRAEYPVKPGLVIGHEPVGVIEDLGPGVTGYEVGDLALGGAEAGGKIEGPMALVILGGLITSTALNLLVLPVLAARWGSFSPAEIRES